MIKNKDIWNRLEYFESVLIELKQSNEDLEGRLIGIKSSLNELHDLITKDSIYESFERSWETIKARDLVFTENVSKINVMINEFKGLIALSRADFNRTNKTYSSISRDGNQVL